MQRVMTSGLLGVRDEGRAALMIAALGSPDAALAGWQRLLTSAPDIWTDPIAARWLPLVAWNLRDARLDDRSARTLGDVQRAVWAANQALWAAVVPALDALAAAGIRVMLLKGAPLAFTSFETPALRPLGDVDILVDPSRATEANDVLIDLRWIASRPLRRRELACLHGLDYRNGSRGALDLHWYLLHECCWPGADSGVWRRARETMVAGRSALIPSAADQLLHVCVHGLRWSPVHSAHWVADALCIITRAGSGLAWDIVIEEARQRKLSHQMHETLSLLRREWRAGIPDHVLQRLGGRGASVWRRLECRVKGRPRVGFGNLFLIWCNWRRLSRAPARPHFAAYLSATVGVEPLWRLIPWSARHLAVRLFAPWRRPRGTSMRPTFR
jgi:hypothetical protein